MTHHQALQDAVLRELLARYAMLDLYLGVVWGRNTLQQRDSDRRFLH